jgi:hypothetical protein
MMVTVVVADVAVTVGVGELAARQSWPKILPSYSHKIRQHHRTPPTPSAENAARH